MQGRVIGDNVDHLPPKLGPVGSFDQSSVAFVVPVEGSSLDLRVDEGPAVVRLPASHPTEEPFCEKPGPGQAGLAVAAGQDQPEASQEHKSSDPH